MVNDSERWPVVMCPPGFNTTDRSYKHKETALDRRLAKVGLAVFRKIIFWSFVYIVFLLALPA